jgi:hypothetical protein
MREDHFQDYRVERKNHNKNQSGEKRCLKSGLLMSTNDVSFVGAMGVETWSAPPRKAHLPV